MLSPTTPASTEETTDNQEDVSQSVLSSHSGTRTPLLKPKSVLRKRAYIRATNKNVMQEKQLCLYDAAHKVLCANEDDEDELTVTGKKFAFQLKKLNDSQRLIAEKLWSDIIFYGAQGKLNFDCTINLPSKNLQQSTVVGSLPQTQHYDTTEISYQTSDLPYQGQESTQERNNLDTLLKTNLSEYILLQPPTSNSFQRDS